MKGRQPHTLSSSSFLQGADYQKEVKAPVICGTSTSEPHKQPTYNKDTLTDLLGWRPGPGCFSGKAFISNEYISSLTLTMLLQLSPWKFLVRISGKNQFAHLLPLGMPQASRPELLISALKSCRFLLCQLYLSPTLIVMWCGNAVNTACMPIMYKHPACLTISLLEEFCGTGTTEASTY